MLKDSKAKSRVVILLTDGANNAGEISPETAADAARALGIKVYTIGMGQPGQVPVPVDSIFGGKEIVYQESDLDEALLQQIAEKTGGQYFRATDTADLQRIYDHINQLKRARSKSRATERSNWMMWARCPRWRWYWASKRLSQTLFRRIP
jgi:Ca-activated chloride channel family protein